MRRNFDPVHLFNVPELRDENTVMNCQSKEISENIEQLIWVMLNNEWLPEAS
jgi:hypothetical protein